MKTFSPKLQKYIDTNKEKTIDIGVLVLVAAFFIVLLLMIHTLVEFIFDRADFMALVISLLDLSFVTLMMFLRNLNIKSKKEEKLSAMEKGTFDFANIKNWTLPAYNIDRLIVNFKLEQAFKDDIITTKFKRNSVQITLMTSKMMTITKLNDIIRNDFSVSAENTQINNDGSSYRFELSLNNLKLLEPQDIVEYHVLTQ